MPRQDKHKRVSGQCRMSRVVKNRTSPEAAPPRSRCKSRPGGHARRGRLVAIALTAAMSLASGAAVAGDYYLRGGIGLDWPGDAAFTDTNCVVKPADWTPIGVVTR